MTISDGSRTDWPSPALLHKPSWCVLDIVNTSVCVCPPWHLSNNMSAEKWPKLMIVFSILIAYWLSTPMWDLLLTNSSPSGGFSAAFRAAGDSDRNYWFLFASLDISFTWVLPPPLMCTNRSAWPQPEQLDIVSAMFALSHFWLSEI